MSMAMRRLLSYLLIAIAVIMAVVIYRWSTQATTAPNITFTQLDGQRLPLESLRGKVVVVNFWATSCTTCIAEMPEMVETYEKYHAQGFDFIAVAMSYDPPNYVANYKETRQLPFTVALDSDGKAAKAFGNVQLTPTTFVIDKQGRIIHHYVGAPNFAQFHSLIEKELAS
jgi:peroxiredoxin